MCKTITSNVLAGISMEGDDELLAEMEVKVAPQRDEWMTNLPPERKVGSVILYSFSCRHHNSPSSAFNSIVLEI